MRSVQEPSVGFFSLAELTWGEGESALDVRVHLFLIVQNLGISLGLICEYDKNLTETIILKFEYFYSNCALQNPFIIMIVGASGTITAPRRWETIVDFKHNITFI